MPKFTKNDLTGKRFGNLVAINFVPDNSGYAKFNFLCDCGKQKTIMSQHVIGGFTTSCGCNHKKIMKNLHFTHGHGGRGKKRHPTYSSWASMMGRCEWSGHPTYAQYGAKGIRVFDKWKRFEGFLDDMGERPYGTSIDRIDNNQGYLPGNCRWSTRKEQALNKSATIKVVFEGNVVVVQELCEKLGLSIPAVTSRAWRRGKNYALALQSFGVSCQNI